MRRKPKSAFRGYKYMKYTSSKQPCLCRRIINRSLAVKTKKFVKKKNPKIICSNSKSGHFEDEKGPRDFTIYCIVNTGFFMNRGNLAASVARAFLGLYNKVDQNRAKASVLDSWEDSGEKLVVLKGINHRHLRFLAKDLRYAAVESYALYKAWGRNQIMLVLSIIGREEELEELLDGLSYLK